jgi:hypothetical protein
VNIAAFVLTIMIIAWNKPELVYFVSDMINVHADKITTRFRLVGAAENIVVTGLSIDHDMVGTKGCSKSMLYVIGRDPTVNSFYSGLWRKKERMTFLPKELVTYRNRAFHGYDMRVNLDLVGWCRATIFPNWVKLPDHSTLRLNFSRPLFDFFHKDKGALNIGERLSGGPPLRVGQSGIDGYQDERDNGYHEYQPVMAGLLSVIGAYFIYIGLAKSDGVAQAIVLAIIGMAAVFFATVQFLSSAPPI